MTRVGFCGIICGLLLSSHAIGFTFNKLPQMLKQKISSPSSAKILKTDKCIDLSGSWQGKCVYNDSEGNYEEDDSISISQSGCESIEMFGSYYDIGGAFRESRSNSQDSSDMNLYLYWNKDADKLKAKFFGVGRVFAVGDISALYNYNGDFDFVLTEDGKLVSQSIVDVISLVLPDETKQTFKSSSKCVYEKQTEPRQK